MCCVKRRVGVTVAGVEPSWDVGMEGWQNSAGRIISQLRFGTRNSYSAGLSCVRRRERRGQVECSVAWLCSTTCCVSDAASEWMSDRGQSDSCAALVLKVGSVSGGTSTTGTGCIPRADPSNNVTPKDLGLECAASRGGHCITACVEDGTPWPAALSRPPKRRGWISGSGVRISDGRRLGACVLQRVRCRVWRTG